MGKLLSFSILAAAIAVGVALRLIPRSWDMRPARPSTNPEETMKAIVYNRHGDHSVLKFDESHPKPIPRKDQVLVRVMASSLNPVDFKMRRNKFIPRFFIPLPKIPGCDIAGVVEDPINSSKFKVGDRVAAMLPIIGSRWGANAEYVAVHESFLAKIGDNTDFESAAAFPLVGLTVLQDFKSLGYTKNKEDTENKKILVHAGAGGVGTFAVQYAKRVLGMYVATTASRPKEELLKNMGADIVIDYKNENFEEIIRDFDVVLDPMSWLYEQRTLHSNVLKPTGHYLNVPSSDWGFADGVERTNGIHTFINLLMSKVKNLIHPGSSPKYSMVVVNPSGRDLQYVMDLIDQGTIQPIIDKKFHLSEASQAYLYLEKGHTTGKVVLYHSEKI